MTIAKDLAISKIEILQSLPLLERNDLAPHLEIVTCKAGDFVVRENTTDSDVYFVVEGQAQVCHADSDGKEVILALIKQGDVFGEIAALAKTPRTADIIATLPCIFLKISAGNLLRHFEKWPGLSSKLLLILAKKLSAASSRIRDLALDDVITRTIKILVEMSEVGDYNDKSYKIVNPKPTQQTLANMVGTSREVISRTLKKLEDGGTILIVDDRLILL